MAELEKPKTFDEKFKTLKKYNVVYQAYNQSVEELYFWFISENSVSPRYSSSLPALSNEKYTAEPRVTAPRVVNQ